MTQHKNRRDDVFHALPGTAFEIAAKIGASDCTVRRHLVALHHQKKVRICDYQVAEGGCPPTQVFEAGDGPDQPSPQMRRFDDVRDGDERCTLGRRVERDNVAARNLARRWADKAARGETMDPMLAHLFGRVKEEKEAA